MSETASIEDLQKRIQQLENQLDEERHRRQVAEDELQYINDELRQQNKEISDSINYAKRIQTAILPPMTLVHKHLPNCFILYMAKDVVSGDFYFVEARGDEVVFAVVDCTGHGVPGALMSVVGFEYLSQAVNEKGLTKPSDILSHMDWGVNNKLRQTVEPGGLRDGMDVSVCTINRKTNELQYAGSYNPLYMVKDGEFVEIKPDKIPIGGDGVVDEFTNHNFDMKDGDMVYLISDGYPDQFGGPRGKKFMYKPFRELLHSISNKNIKAQHDELLDTFHAWRGDHEQVDDISLLGVRV